MQQQTSSSKNAPQRSKNIKTDSFLEALKGIGSSVSSSAKNDLLKPGIKDIFDSLSPFNQSQDNQKQDSGEISGLSENYWERKYHEQKRQLETVKREEKIVFNRQERETQVQVKNIQDEIKKLVVATGELSHEVQIAAMQEEVTPGIYHLNFLQKLFSLIASLRSGVQESSLWLASWNNKSQKKNGYWSKYKKSGSSFSLHHDQAIATQAG